jgi:molybdenum cofactor cytidylyltransferase
MGRASAGSKGVGDVAGIVLAAGGGSRFAGGSHKLVAPFRGRPLVAWSIEAAAEAELSAVVVVAGALELEGLAREVAGERVTVIVNAGWQRGQASSLLLGIDWCAERGYAAAVVGLGDQPLIGAAAWRTVAAADQAPVVTATFGGRRRPPVRLDRSTWPLLTPDGDEGARELMRRRPELVAEVACEGDPADVDTLDDLRRHDEASAGTSRQAGPGR